MKQVAFLNTSFEPQIIKLGQLLGISKDNSFQESFEQFGGLRPGPRRFSI